MMPYTLYTTALRPRILYWDHAKSISGLLKLKKRSKLLMKLQ
jgi:hypothetical protein